eukprot:CAMPEP_0195266296 /NCGR_PEP_ID=MMETSP0706-20130129/11926_1 /TAXON_ID=33640 /ORGANISM="Asterionellopsis glacialis, Strain CCMP134" /LENGTH=89 /DNA_ID=CAMNT_0040320861 /DNA_START=93 /DNA_END=362 /DNA_ORIENTATION=-
MAGAATTTSLAMGGKPAKKAKTAEDDLELTRKVISGFLGDVEQVEVAKPAPAAKASTTDEPADEEDSDEPKKNIISRAKDKIKKKLSKD